MPKTGHTRRPCELWLRAYNNLPQPPKTDRGCGRLLHALTPTSQGLLVSRVLARCHPYILPHDFTLVTCYVYSMAYSIIIDVLMYNCPIPLFYCISKKPHEVRHKELLEGISAPLLRLAGERAGEWAQSKPHAPLLLQLASSLRGERVPLISGPPPL